MDTQAIATLLIGVAGLITSIVVVLEMRRQRNNDVRPVLAVIEKAPSDSDDSALTLYLVNMGYGVAVNVSVEWQEAPPNVHPAALRQEVIAPGRRARLGSGHSVPILRSLRLRVSYEDIENACYVVDLVGGRHRYGPGSRR